MAERGHPAVGDDETVGDETAGEPPLPVPPPRGGRGPDGDGLRDAGEGAGGAGRAPGAAAGASLEPGAAASGDAVGDLLTLQVWLSPAFPVGGFTYSHGLEWAIEDGTVTGAASLERWLGDVLTHGAGRSDAVLLARAHAAATAGDIDGLAEVIGLSAALQPSKERRLEASAQGAAFVRAITDTWSTPAFERLVAALGARFAAPGVPWTHAPAVGVAAAAHGLMARDVVPAFVQAFAANVVSAGVRAIPLGQSDGLRIVRGLTPLVRRIAEAALAAPLDAVGGATILADIASMKHETQYTRLFRS